MTPDRWQQIDDLLQATLLIPAAERRLYLIAACKGDAELQHEVESLLQFHSQADEFLEAPPAEMAAEIVQADRTPSLLGRTINRYQIERQLGAGGMGVVYLARDTELNRPVALKVLPAHLTQDADRVRRFRQEARATSALNHPNLLTIYEVGQVDSEQFIAAEYVEGRTLRELLRTDTLQLGQVLELTIQITDALTAAHQAGIVHRDIKPENIMVRPDSIVKVLDFGLAKLLEEKGRRGDGETGRRGEEETHKRVAALSPPLPHSPSPLLPHSPAVSLTAPGLVLGTVSYMSPEQARGQPVDARSDLFSVGVVLYELVTGYKPFVGETPSDVIAALLERTPHPLSHYLLGLPAALQEIINQALAKGVAERYQTAREFGAALKQLHADLTLAAHLDRSADKATPLTMKVGAQALGEEITRLLNVPTHSQSTLRFRFWQQHSRRLGWLAVASLLLLAGGFAGRYWWQPKPVSFNSIAVLPFSQAGNEAQTEFLPDALTENLIDSLTRLPSLRVSAYNTISAYKGRPADPRQIGKELQVAAVITGRIVGQGERMTARVELVDTADGARLWGEDFLLPRAQLLTAQTEIAREIAAKLRLRLSPENERQLAKRYPTDGKAYELYAQGRYLYRQYNRASQEKALEFFRQAIALDANYALAYCGIADVYADFSGQYLPPSEAMPKARDAALKALELDEALPEAHHSLALVKLWDNWDWTGAEREIKRALELNPNLASTRIYYAEFLSQRQRFEEALREIKRAQEYDPGSSRARGWEASINIRMRQYDRALEIYRQTLERQPDNTGVQRQVVLILSHQGKHQEALARWQQLLAPNPPTHHLAWLSYFYAKAGQRKEALKIQQKVEALARGERASPVSFLLMEMGLGNQEKALAWLQQAYTAREEFLLNLVDPIYDPLRNDPRFVEILRGVGLTP